jgi:hypothetical protein
MKEVELSEYKGKEGGDVYCSQIYHVDSDNYVVAITSGGMEREERFDRLRIVGSVPSLEDTVEEESDAGPLIRGGHLVVVDGEGNQPVIDKRKIRDIRDVA